MSDPGRDPRRALPAVDAALARPGIVPLLQEHPRAMVVDAVRRALARRRAAAEGPDGLDAEVARALRPSLRPVINATGVLLHTNLGRAPLAEPAVAAVVRAARFCTLEWDPDEGVRASRHDHVVDHLRALTGAEDACVANTNAGAVLLALVALGGGGEVIVSRGQLVEIGGGFRVPEVLAASGCRLVEVGTTNRTRLADYRAAITPETTAILRVHPSNFRVVGFTEEVPLAALAGLARQRGLRLIDDAGSGALAADDRWPDEPSVRDSVAAGCDLVAFSGDKLLGGPQAGILVGRSPAVARARGHALMRALRPDKLTVAALEATLALLRDPASEDLVPVRGALREGVDQRERRARALAVALGGEVVITVGRVGGGTLPLHGIDSRAVALDDPRGPEALAAGLRDGDPALAVRVHRGRVLIDVLALDDADVERIPALVLAAR